MSNSQGDVFISAGNEPSVHACVTASLMPRMLGIGVFYFPRQRGFDLWQ